VQIGASRTASDAPRPAPWPAIVAIASRRAAIASRHMSVGSRRVATTSRHLAMASRRGSDAFRAQLARIGRGRPNLAVTRAQAGGALAVVVGLATLTGITGVLSGGKEGEVGNAYGSSGSGAVRSSLPDGPLTALEASNPSGVANSGHRRQSRDKGHGQGHGGDGQAGTARAGSGDPGGVAGKSTGSGTPYSGGDGSYVAAPVSPPAPAPSPSPSPTPTSDGPVTSTVRNLDRTASDAGANTNLSGATDGVTKEVDRTAGSLSNRVSGTTDGLLGD
jgi:hypothetical protein